MLFAVIFTDKPDHGALRAENLDAHVRWVAEHQDQVLVAGSLRVHTCGLRQGVEVLHWRKALDRKVLV